MKDEVLIESYDPQLIEIPAIAICLMRARARRDSAKRKNKLKALD